MTSIIQASLLTFTSHKLLIVIKFSVVGEGGIHVPRHPSYGPVIRVVDCYTANYSDLVMKRVKSRMQTCRPL